MNASLGSVISVLGLPPHFCSRLPHRAQRGRHEELTDCGKGLCEQLGRDALDPWGLFPPIDGHINLALIVKMWVSMRTKSRLLAWVLPIT